MERVRARAYIGHVASLFRAACVNHPFEASSASHTLLAPDIQRYFRDINVLHQHPAIQPNSCDEIYDRVLAGVDPNSEIVRSRSWCFRLWRSEKTAGSSGCTRIPSGGSARTRRLMGITNGPLDIGCT